VEDLERKASEEEFLAHFGVNKDEHGIYHPPAMPTLPRDQELFKEEWIAAARRYLVEKRRAIDLVAVLRYVRRRYGS
jgi:hypothetical protein